MACFFAVALGASSHAASVNITPPFDIGSMWNVCQGYNNTFGTHTGTSSLSLDITGGPGCDNSGNGKNIRAPFPGVVSWYSAGSGSLCISDSGSRSIMLTHIDSSVAPGTIVTNGQIIGTIAAPFQRQNNGVAHLHLQAWSATGCGNDSKRVPFDSASSMRICGAPDMTITGPNPYNNGVWSGSGFIAQSCLIVAQKSSGSIYRFWSDRYMGHFYTADYDEAQRVSDTWPDVWKHEPAADLNVLLKNLDGTCAAGSQPVHRFWSDRYMGHFYTADEAEKNRVISTWPDVWKYEGVKYCAGATSSAELSKPVHRFWSDRYMGHFYTADEAEKNRVISTWPDVWKYEGVAYYAK